MFGLIAYYSSQEFWICIGVLNIHVLQGAIIACLTLMFCAFDTSDGGRPSRSLLALYVIWLGIFISRNAEFP